MAKKKSPNEVRLETLLKELEELKASLQSTPSAPRRVTRLEMLEEKAAESQLIITTSTSSSVREIRFLRDGKERFVAHGIKQAETWLDGFTQAKAA